MCPLPSVDNGVYIAPPPKSPTVDSVGILRWNRVKEHTVLHFLSCSYLPQHSFLSRAPPLFSVCIVELAISWLTWSQS
ncbi:V-type proton ATPase subunit E2-like protein [Corchorus olitorius]|uniref:V-type proton ATPase subunit E2-like protein n=1 Tax=Corchorus olitorius TaxID=93759 RepID=A0A1R3KP72_9ROSI|nr:V-type proton ATPase subunit E2-like protein [Corchorus olitorius]